MELNPHGWYKWDGEQIIALPYGETPGEAYWRDPLRIVGYEERQGGAIRISTVFLCTPHYGPSGAVDALWETMIYWTGGPLDDWQQRYTSVEDAREGHKKAIEWVEAALEPYEE